MLLKNPTFCLKHTTKFNYKSSTWRLVPPHCAVEDLVSTLTEPLDINQPCQNHKEHEAKKPKLRNIKSKRFKTQRKEPKQQAVAGPSGQSQFSMNKSYMEFVI